MNTEMNDACVGIAVVTCTAVLVATVDKYTLLHSNKTHTCLFRKSPCQCSLTGNRKMFITRHIEIFIKRKRELRSSHVYLFLFNLKGN